MTLKTKHSAAALWSLTCDLQNVNIALLQTGASKIELAHEFGMHIR